uniref:Nephrocystin 3-like N-terminal domain-containing protein n=1 Tax=Fusarium oxysporum (strain Fo5176) TaxID=660025 RepID=A0A0D2Y714_FUSOF
MASEAAAAASLEPDIRLAQAISMLLADLSDEQRRSFRTQQDNFLPPTITDVMRVVAKVDIVAGGKQKGGGRTFGPRLTGFLEAVQEFASIGEVELGGSMSLLATSVWLIVCLTLTILAEYPRWLEKASMTLMSAGRNAPRRMEITLFYARTARSRKDDHTRQHALTILYSLYRQLAKDRQDRVLFLENLHTDSFDTRLMTKALGDALKTNKKTYIVVDGLDECKDAERSKVINVLQGLQIYSPLSICLSSRPGILSHIGWAGLHSIYIPEDNPDIELYVDSELSSRFEHGELVVGHPALEESALHLPTQGKELK